jgi:hypothetical protein
VDGIRYLKVMFWERGRTENACLQRLNDRLHTWMDACGQKTSIKLNAMSSGGAGRD